MKPQPKGLDELFVIRYLLFVYVKIYVVNDGFRFIVLSIPPEADLRPGFSTRFRNPGSPPFSEFKLQGTKKKGQNEKKHSTISTSSTNLPRSKGLSFRPLRALDNRD